MHVAWDNPPPAPQQRPGRLPGLLHALPKPAGTQPHPAADLWQTRGQHRLWQALEQKRQEGVEVPRLKPPPAAAAGQAAPVICRGLGRRACARSTQQGGPRPTQACGLHVAARAHLPRWRRKGSGASAAPAPPAGPLCRLSAPRPPAAARRAGRARGPAVGAQHGAARPPAPARVL